MVGARLRQRYRLLCLLFVALDKLIVVDDSLSRSNLALAFLSGDIGPAMCPQNSSSNYYGYNKISDWHMPSYHKFYAHL